MAKKKKPSAALPRNHLKAWREFRGKTQEWLAEKAGTSKGVISQIEGSKRGLDHKWLLKLAPLLQTTPGYLLDHDPNDLPTAILDIWAAIPDEARPQAESILKTFAKKAG